MIVMVSLQLDQHNMIHNAARCCIDPDLPDTPLGQLWD